jgi:hypothetical protein
MDILGLMTVALVAGTVAHAAYDGPKPDGFVAALGLGLTAVLAGAAVSHASGIGRIESMADPATWLTVTAWSALLLGFYGAVTQRLRSDAPNVLHAE